MRIELTTPHGSPEYSDAENRTQTRKRDNNQITTRTINVYELLQNFIHKKLFTSFKNVHFLSPIKIHS